ncbi:MAG: hypothetical protein J6V04_03305, partial [Bacteroidales bacterium]|nr:hypothetical protein [Bacteroidales bacterium]
DEQVYEKFPNRILNVHPALIPSFCGKGYYGLKVHEAALSKGVKVSGATVHIVTPECDAGPIVLQKAVNVLDTDTPESLQERIMKEAEWKILPEAVRLFCPLSPAVECLIIPVYHIWVIFSSLSSSNTSGVISLNFPVPPLALAFPKILGSIW